MSIHRNRQKQKYSAQTYSQATHACPRCNIQSKPPHSPIERFSAPSSSDTTVAVHQTLLGAFSALRFALLRNHSLSPAISAALSRSSN